MCSLVQPSAAAVAHVRTKLAAAPDREWAPPSNRWELARIHTEDRREVMPDRLHSSVLPGGSGARKPGAACLERGARSLGVAAAWSLVAHELPDAPIFEERAPACTVAGVG
jgi:hypothetical protein